MVEPGKKPSLGKSELAGEICNDRENVDRGKLPLNLRRALLDVLARNVDRHVCGRMDGLQQDRSLSRRTGAELDDRDTGRHSGADFRHDAVEKRGFRAGRVIARQARDGVEQLRAALVVQPAGGDRGDWRREPREHVAAERSGLRVRRREQDGVR